MMPRVVHSCFRTQIFKLLTHIIAANNAKSTDITVVLYENKS